MKNFRLLLAGLTFLTLMFVINDAIANEFQEEQVKVAFIYNFAKFVEWPNDAFKSEATPIGIYVLGSDPISSILDTLKEKTLRGRKFNLRRVTRLDNLEECHILFIGASERNNIRNVLASIKNDHILTVSDMDRFAQQGGMIGLATIEGKISFEVNIDAVQHSRLKFSSQLLKLAKIVHSGS